MSALLDLITEFKEDNNQMLTEIKDDNAKHARDFLEQDKLMTKIQLKKDVDNTDRVVSSTEKMAVLITKMATANSRSSNETIEILNDICKELEQRNGNLEDSETDFSHLHVG